MNLVDDGHDVGSLKNKRHDMKTVQLMLCDSPYTRWLLRHQKAHMDD
jgi:hypothetical protein